MKKHTSIYCIFLIYFLMVAPFALSQSLSDAAGLDKDFLESLPETVRDDVMKEMKSGLDEKTNNLQKRPSSELSKLDTVKDWEDFRKKNFNTNKSERYGLKLFNTMQSSFMPINQPNFGSNYTLDYGDSLAIQLFGNSKNDTYSVEVSRDGSILLKDIGKVIVSGLNFDQVADVIKKKYESSFIGINVIVTLLEIRDVNILITGNVEFPGMYTLSGNSNVLQALNIAGGITETGSLRNITIKRKGRPDTSIDLYEALIFGNTDSIPVLMSGDSIYIEPARSLVRAGYGFNNVAIYELKDDESLKDLIRFSGGLNMQANNSLLNLVRFESGKFSSFQINLDDEKEYKIKNLDSIYAYKEKIGTVTISGNIKHPGKYSISSNDRILDVIKRSGGYIDSAYKFGASLHREEARELEKAFADKTYKNLITFIASNPNVLSSTGGAGGLSYILSELKMHEPMGRVIAEFDEENLKSNIQDNIYLIDGDKIHIPTYSSNVYVFGEVGNQGAVLFKENINMIDYINKSGGFTRFASSEFIFIVSPNGETKKVTINGLKKYIAQDYEIYPGSVIYIPRHVGKIQGLSFYATIAPIFSSLAISIASLNAIKN